MLINKVKKFIKYGPKSWRTGLTADSPRPGGAFRGPKKRTITTAQEAEEKKELERKRERESPVIKQLRFKGILSRIKKMQVNKQSKERRQQAKNKKNVTRKQTWIKEILRMAHLNCQGINKLDKRNRIENWADRKQIKILAITETQHAHTSEEGGKQKENLQKVTRGGQYKWYYSSGIDPKRHAELEEARKTKMGRTGTLIRHIKLKQQKRKITHKTHAPKI